MHRKGGREGTRDKEREKLAVEVLEGSNLSDDECVSHYCSDTRSGEMI